MSVINATTATSSTATTDQRALVENYEAFLQILTSQLRNQSPLEPLNANEFTQQLVQYSSVEQAIKTNASLDDLIALNTSNQAVGLVGYLNRQVEAEGAATMLEGGRADWRLDVEAAAPQSSLAIRNAAGQTLYRQTVNLTQGVQNFTWDGRTNDGTIAPDGLYSLTLEARNDDGDLVEVSTAISGTVSGVDLSANPPLLLVGQAKVPINAVTSVQAVP